MMPEISLDSFETKIPKPDNFLSKKQHKRQLMQPLNSSEKSMIERIKKQGKFNHAQIMKLIRAARDTDFDIEAEIDWKYDTLEAALDRIKHKTTMKQLPGENY